MSKFLKVMIVLLTIAAVATPVMAEDRLSLAGQMRVRGWFVDQGDFVDDNGTEADLTDDFISDRTESWMDQRLRVGGKLSIAEGVSVTFRTDITESNWGSNAGFGSGRSGSTQQWDRAHLDIGNDSMHLRAGQQYLAFGKNGFDAQDNGLTFNTFGAIPVTAFFMINEDGGGKDQTDAYFYGARIAHKGEAYASQLFVAGQTGGAGSQENVNVIGLTLDLDLSPVKLYGEAEFFTGDASATQDATGTQVLLIADMAASDTINVGAKLFYSMGDDTDVVYSILGNDFGGWDPLFEMGTGLDNEQIGAGRPFAVWQQAGIIAVQLNGSVKVSDALTVAAVAGMGQTEDDAIIDDDATFFGAGVSYAVMSNTKLGAQVEYIDRDLDTDANLQAGVGLFVNF
ncbi:MAG TPA: hypothetical protein VJ974_07845 [Geopsychrobacteraceae bacterium]|nr:hypothetical protein [Geopsychrobacteraceae bacterium]